MTSGDGRKGDELHNAYPNAYTGVYDTYIESKTGGNGVQFSRAGTSGAQANSIFWAGDQASTFGAFQEAVRAGISAGQSGIPFWAWDLAGFTGSFPSSELYLRSTAMATFSPVMQYHSEKASPSPSEARTPWNVQARTGDTSVVPTFRKFANVRMNLVPYLYTEARNSSNTGLPLMQAMGIQYGSDTTASAQDQQYMFGRQLLVAPITAQGASAKNVYLPAGEWYDFWNGGRAQGPGTKTYVAGTDSIPVYAKAGAIIPLNLNANYELGGNIGNSVTSYPNLVFRIYPSGTSSYDYFEDSAGADQDGHVDGVVRQPHGDAHRARPHHHVNPPGGVDQADLGDPQRHHAHAAGLGGGAVVGDRGLVLGSGAAADVREAAEQRVGANRCPERGRQGRVRGRVREQHRGG